MRLNNAFIRTKLDLTRVHLPHFLLSLIHHSIKRGSDRQSPAHDSTDADQEAGKRLCASFTIDDFHWRDVLDSNVGLANATGQLAGVGVICLLLEELT